jgi:hypothetical protein
VATVIEEAEANIRTIHEWHSERAIKLWVSLRTLPKRIQTSFLREGWTSSGLKGLVHVNDYPAELPESFGDHFDFLVAGLYIMNYV